MILFNIFIKDRLPGYEISLSDILFCKIMVIRISDQWWKIRICCTDKISVFYIKYYPSWLNTNPNFHNCPVNSKFFSIKISQHNNFYFKIKFNEINSKNNSPLKTLSFWQLNLYSIGYSFCIEWILNLRKI